MRKILMIILAVFAMMIFVGCGGNSGGRASDLGFGEFRDTQTGITMSIGDLKSDFEQAFGVGQLYDSGRTRDTYEYFDGLMRATFESSSGELVLIRFYAPERAPQEGRFEILDMWLGMTREELIEVEGTIAFQLETAGMTGRSISPEGEIRSVTGPRRNTYGALATVEGDYVVMIQLSWED